MLFLKSQVTTHYGKTFTTKPDLGFGSIQVDLGGMMSLASATAITSLSKVGYIAIASLQSRLHLLSSSLIPLIPPLKSILLSLLKSEIVKIGARIKSVIT